MQYIIAQADAEDAAHTSKGFPIGIGEETAILICTHAASLIAIGRALTGDMPDDVCKNDFATFTCGISKFERKSLPQPETQKRFAPVEPGMPIPSIKWREGHGIAGGWHCTINGDCKHLQGGEERGWQVCSFPSTSTRLSDVT